MIGGEANSAPDVKRNTRLLAFGALNISAGKWMAPVPPKGRKKLDNCRDRSVPFGANGTQSVGAARTSFFGRASGLLAGGRKG